MRRFERQLEVQEFSKSHRLCLFVLGVFKNVVFRASWSKNWYLFFLSKWHSSSVNSNAQQNDASQSLANLRFWSSLPGHLIDHWSTRHDYLKAWLWLRGWHNDLASEVDSTYWSVDVGSLSSSSKLVRCSAWNGSTKFTKFKIECTKITDD
jgi:hypothetical protein